MVELSNIVGTYGTLAMLLIITVILIYNIHKDTIERNQMFQIQMTAAKTNKIPDISKLTYPELMKIVNETIDYYTTQNMAVLSLHNKNSAEISLLIDELSADIATKVKVSISKYVSECIICYVTEDFYDRYILNSVRLMLVAQIEKQRRASASKHHHHNKPKTKSPENK